MCGFSAVIYKINAKKSSWKSFDQQIQSRKNIGLHFPETPVLGPSGQQVLAHSEALTFLHGFAETVGREKRRQVATPDASLLALK